MGKTTQTLSGPGEVSWKVDPKGDFATVKVSRSDTKSCAILQLERIDLNGHWVGTHLEQGCDFSSILVAVKELKGKPLPLTMDITAEVENTGMATILVEAGTLGGESEPNTVPLTWSVNTVTIQFEDGATMTDTATHQNDQVVMNGTLCGTSGGDNQPVTIKGVLNVTKQGQ